jgi:formamidopyrimidine-DNA glycosylase
VNYATHAYITLIAKQQQDNKVFVDKEPEEFKKILLNKKLVDTKRRGKYFILRK